MISVFILKVVAFRLSLLAFVSQVGHHLQESHKHDTERSFAHEEIISPLGHIDIFSNGHRTRGSFSAE